MGTHPIFESDFDCLTEMIRLSVWSRPRLMSHRMSNQVMSHRLMSNHPMSHNYAPYRRDCEYLHDYYTVYTDRVRFIFRETFVQLDPDENTENFLAFSKHKANTSLKHNWLLPRIMGKRSNLEHEKLSRF